MSLTRVVMRLGRNPDAGFPDGDNDQGYVIVAPLDKDGRLDLDLWRANKADCTVDRFSPDPAEKADGWLTHRGSHWFFHYDEEGEGPDEPVYRLGDHTLRLGDYLTIHEADGDDLTYKITETTSV
ncbi:MAG: hypothetical protein NXI03_10895 [Alphaproteobacteria bacterium]|uniref:hypothetical protein n=1 Tax=Maricaulis alexandrii TaxID=2570354 RepID=UPI0011083346|nr:hypothetical protein [Maricaulis alexandrii]MCR9268066.1 hypothetical protein [Alphaproteobacteria bacterium]